MDRFITKKDAITLKGIAILMMISMHIFKLSWINNPSWLIDFKVGGV